MQLQPTRRDGLARLGDRTFGAVAILLPLAFLAVGLGAPLLAASVDLVNLSSDAHGTIASALMPVIARTVFFAAAASIAATLSAWAFALASASFSPAVRRALLICCMLPVVTHFILRTTGLHIVFGPNGPVNSFLLWSGLATQPIAFTYSALGTVLALASWLLPVSTLFMYMAARNVSTELVDAASSLGAGPVAVLRVVWIPQTLPAATLLLGLNLALAYGTFLSPELLGGLEDITVVRLIAQMLREGRSAEAILVATAATAVPIAFFLAAVGARSAILRSLR